MKLSWGSTSLFYNIGWVYSLRTKFYGFNGLWRYVKSITNRYILSYENLKLLFNSFIYYYKYSRNSKIFIELF